VGAGVSTLGVVLTAVCAVLARDGSGPLQQAKMFSIIATIIGAVWSVISFIIGWRFGLSLFGSEQRLVRTRVHEPH
jgi:hypothetical protein